MITLTFNEQEVNLILASLAEQPFKQVHTLIAKIRNEAIPQVEKLQEETITKEIEG